VKGASAAGLSACPDIDGFLVGSASLKDDFVTIIQNSGPCTSGSAYTSL